MLEESMSTGTVPSSLWASILSWFTPTVFFVFVNLTIGTIYFTSTLANSNKPDRQEGDEPNPKLVRSPSVLQRLKSITLYSYRSPEPVSATAYEKDPDLDDDSHHLHFSFQQQLQQQQTPELEQRRQQPFLDRSPSVLQRIRSFNLSSYFSPEPTTSLKSREIYAHYTPKQVSREQEQHGQEQEPEHDEEEEEEEEEEDDDDDFRGELELEEEIKGEEPSLEEVYSQLKDSGHVTRTKSDTKPASGEILTKLPKKMRKSASVKSAFSHFEEDDIVETRRPATVREGKAKATEEDEVDARADDFINKFKQQLKLQRMDSILRSKDGVNRGNGR